MNDKQDSTIVYKKIVLFSVLFFPPLMIFLLREFFELNYLSHSIYKLVYVLPLFYRYFWDRKSFKKSLTEGFNFGRFKMNVWAICGIGIAFVAIYLSAYWLLQDMLQLDVISQNLNQYIKIDAGNIIYIGLYIIIFNSLLEEFFWRGFMFKELSSMINTGWANFLTAVGFSIYHILMFYDWFILPFILLASFGLAVFGVFMNIVFKMQKDLFSCWLIHGFADLAQIVIALYIFEVI